MNLCLEWMIGRSNINPLWKFGTLENFRSNITFVLFKQAGGISISTVVITRYLSLSLESCVIGCYFTLKIKFMPKSRTCPLENGSLDTLSETLENCYLRVGMWVEEAGGVCRVIPKIFPRAHLQAWPKQKG